MTELFFAKSSTVYAHQVPKYHSDISVTKYIFYTNNDNIWSICRSGQSSEGFSVKKVFWKVSQNLAEKTCVGVSL